MTHEQAIPRDDVRSTSLFREDHWYTVGQSLPAKIGLCGEWGNMSGTYVFTDVHGRADLLRSALQWIVSDANGSPVRVVGLGDYVDRGPDTLAVLDMLSKVTRMPGWDVTLLQGNHDRLMVEAVEGDQSMLGLWLDNGGARTLASFGVDASDISSLQDHPHLDMLRQLPRSVEDDARIYVHAGMRPGLSLAEQSDEDLLWIRDDFLLSSYDFGKIVVHGHTPCERPEVRPNRINLDTGACFPRGCLTVARWKADNVSPLFQVFSSMA